MAFNPRDLPSERPSSFDSEGRRVFLYPAEVTGWFKKARTYVYGLLILVFLVLPWVTWNGQQVILLQLLERKFSFFGLTYYAHDGPLLIFVFFTAVFGICFVTSIWGRVWCGWACPQTVFLDFLFRRVETLIEGNYRKRMSADSKPMSTALFSKKTLKWFLFFILASHISHSFFAYFVGANKLVWITLSSPAENWTLFIMVQFLTIVLLFDFGWFREQFCIIMCPYGRFQSVLMNTFSKAVLYDHNRGEPRGRSSADKKGDCVDCYKCVIACPTGIDIREGIQMECIACTACMDACDEVMEKVGTAKGLIRYSSENQLQTGKKDPISMQSIVFAVALVLTMVTAGFFLGQRGAYSLQVLRAIEAPFSVSGNTVSNHFRLKVKNQSTGVLKLKQLSCVGCEVVAPTLPLSLTTEQTNEVHVFVKVPLDIWSDKKVKVLQYKLELKMNIENQDELVPIVVKFIGP